MYILGSPGGPVPYNKHLNAACIGIIIIVNYKEAGAGYKGNKYNTIVGARYAGE